MLTPQEKRNWFEATELLRVEQERIIAELRAENARLCAAYDQQRIAANEIHKRDLREQTALRTKLTELEDAILDMNPISPAVFVAHGKLPELRNRIIAERKNLAAQVSEQ